MLFVMCYVCTGVTLLIVSRKKKPLACNSSMHSSFQILPPFFSRKGTALYVGLRISTENVRQVRQVSPNCRQLNKVDSYRIWKHNFNHHNLPFDMWHWDPIWDQHRVFRYTFLHLDLKCLPYIPWTFADYETIMSSCFHREMKMQYTF